MMFINLYPGGGTDGLPPSFYIPPPAGESYQIDSNGNVITDINGVPQLSVTDLTVIPKIQDVTKNIASAKSDLPSSSIIPGIDNNLILIGSILMVAGIIYIISKRKK